MITFNTVKFQSNQNKTRTAKPALKNNAGLSQDSVSFSGAKLKAADFDPTREVGKYGIKAIIAKITRFTGTIKKGNFEAEFQKGTKVGEKRFRNDGTLSVSRIFDDGQLFMLTTHKLNGKTETTQIYNGNNRLLSKIEHSTTGWKKVTAFDPQGFKVTEDLHDQNDRLRSRSVYDFADELQTVDEYFKSGKLKSSSQWKNGEIVSTVHRREDSTVEQLIEKNKDGGLTSYEYRPNETLEMKIVYNANGRLKSFTPHDAKGNPLETKVAQ